MATPAILDADMATLARMLRGGVDWWREELRGLLPASLRRPALHLARRAPGLVAHWDGERLHLTRRGVAVPPGEAARQAAVVALPAAAVLVREVDLPPLGPADLRRLIAFDADRLLPFAPGAALVAHDVVRPPAIPGGPQGVAVAGVRHEAAAGAMAAAAAAGLEVRGLGVDAGNNEVRFDFLPAWRAAAGAAADRGGLWWGIVGAMFVLNVAVLVGRDVYNLRETAALVEAHGQTAAIARTLRARVVTEDARRRDLVAARAAHDPLPILAAVTRALPDGAWTQRLAWDGTQVRLAGFRGPGVDIVAALRRSPYFVAVRSTAVDIPAPGQALQPFEASADTTREVPR